MIQVFSQQWFDLHQEKLVWLANNPVTKRYFRHALRITEHDCPINEKINNISPNSFSYGAKKHRDGRITITTDFRTHNKFAKRLYYEYNTLWKLFHEFDMRIANLFVPAANLGFDTFYSEIGSGSTTCDGFTQYSTGGTSTGIAYSSLNAQTTATTALTTVSGVSLVALFASTTTNLWRIMSRSYHTFDTSTIGSGVTINDAYLSFYTEASTDALGVSPSLVINDAALANPNTLVAGDFDSIGSTRLASDTPFSSVTVLGYTDVSLNTAGIAYIKTTDVTEFGLRDNYSADDTEPTWSSGVGFSFNYFHVDETGTTKDPKLVVTYTLGSTFTPKIIIF